MSEKELFDLAMTEHVVEDADAASRPLEVKPTKRELACQRFLAPGLLRKPPRA